MPTVVLDPGHGGRDPGGLGPTGYIEKHGTLAIALACRDRLRSAGVNVVMTRETDTDLAPKNQPYSEILDLKARVQLANSIGADYFISIHTNGYPNPSVRGTETYCCVGATTAKRLAQKIHSSVVSALGTQDRGIRERNFYVLVNTEMPAVLVEVAYHTCPSEEAKLKDPAFRQRAGIAIADGILSFLGIAPPAPEPPPTPSTSSLAPLLAALGAVLLNGVGAGFLVFAYKEDIKAWLSRIRYRTRT